MSKSLLAAFVVTGIGLLLAAPAGAATVYSTGFDAGYTAGPLWGQNSWDSSVYGSSPAGTGDTWLSNPNVTVDPVNSANQVLQLYGDCTGGTVHGTGASVKVSVNNTDDITFTQSAYFTGTMAQSNVMSMLGGGNVTFGNYGYWFVGTDAATMNGLAAGNVAWSLWDPTKPNEHTGGTGDFRSILVPKDTWTTASVTFHLATQTADLTVGSQSITGVPAPYVTTNIVGGLTRYDMYIDGQYNSTSNILLDNISITQVPEPASLCLLALGGLAALRRRHA